MGMTVQELIDELMKVEDKSVIVNVIEGDTDNDFVYEINYIEWYGNYPVIAIRLWNARQEKYSSITASGISAWKKNTVMDAFFEMPNATMFARYQEIVR